jgi:hypothetical protein
MPPADTNWKFRAWMKIVEKQVKLQTELDNYGEIDHPFRDWYEEGLSPIAASNLIIDELQQMEEHIRTLLMD